MLIVGESVEAVLGHSFPVHNPATGEVVDCIPQTGPEDVKRAIASATKGRMPTMIRFRVNINTGSSTLGPPGRKKA